MIGGPDFVTRGGEGAFPQRESDNLPQNWDVLQRIAQVFNISMEPRESYPQVEERCFEAAYQACRQQQWAKVEPLLGDLSQITDSKGRTLLNRATEEKENLLAMQFQKYGDILTRPEPLPKDGNYDVLPEIPPQAEGFGYEPIPIDLMSDSDYQEFGSLGRRQEPGYEQISNYVTLDSVRLPPDPFKRDVFQEVNSEIARNFDHLAHSHFRKLNYADALIPRTV